MKNDVAIKVDGIYKSFKLPHEKVSSLKSALLHIAKRKRGYEMQHVLKDVSFEVKKGEFFGIVGRNGSGKSTLLKLLAGIYVPDKGSITINGSLTPFIELGVGFNPELTGRENVFLNGALLGFNRAEMDAMYDDIVDFAELERFMDQKLKNYSSGMQVRLAFSIAIRAKNDILLFDEVLAVGDAAFQQKCFESFSDIKAAGVTVVLVTHDMSAVQRFCDRGILIEDGIIQLNSGPMSIADRYLETNFDKPTKATQSMHDDKNVDSSSAVGGVKNAKLSGTRSLDVGQPIKFSFDTEMSDLSTIYHMGLQIFRSDGVYVYGTNTKNAGHAYFTGDKSFEITFEQNLAPATYSVTLAIMNSQATATIRYLPKQVSFTVKQQTKRQGVVLIDEHWVVT